MSLVSEIRCADCNGPIGQDNGPPDGWQLEDGRTVCQSCCVKDTHKLIHSKDFMNKLGKMMRNNRRKKVFKWVVIMLCALVIIISLGKTINAEESDYTVCVKHEYSQNYPDLIPCPRELINWYNIKTGEIERLNGIPSNDRLREFIPQSFGAQNLYTLYIELGKTPYEAFELVLLKYIE